VIRFSPRPNRAQEIRWREWGDEAFREAEQQDKPLALFVTAFWCGFCQRMDETTLSDEDVAALLNAFFIPVRVEEGQRPDVDLRYNQDGWPTIAFLSPGGTVLASVNYTPPQEFITLLARVVEYFREHRDDLRAVDTHLAASIAHADPIADPAPLEPGIVAEITGMLEGLADREHGGFGAEIKLLHTEANEFLLYLHETTGERAHLDHVLLTLARLRESRTFDTRDGGFFRYSSRADWQEPHPEKLLEDQAALLRNVLHAYLLTDEPRWRELAEELVFYLDGALSPGEIGPYFAGCQDYLHGSGMDFEGGDRSAVLDTLIYCAANAHAASAYLDAWWLLGRTDCRDRAVALLEALWRDLRIPGGGMYHYYDGDERGAPGLLRDTLATGLALLDAYAALGDDRFLEWARELAAEIGERHRHLDGGFVDISQTGPGHLRVPLALLTENATAARFFGYLADLSGKTSYRDRAGEALRPFPNAHREHGAFAAGFAHALARFLSTPVTVTVRGLPGDPKMLTLLRAARTRLHHPNLVVRCSVDAHASLQVQTAGGSTGPIDDPARVQPELLSTTA
jgi:uncharacterized protein